MSNTLALRVNKTLCEYGMLRRGTRVCVALSGGKDSVALLHLLRELSEEHGISLLAVHVNHGIRGDEADRDEAFCRELCDSLGIPFESYRFDVPMLAKEQGTGIEECARNVRYGVFETLISEKRADLVATAHHASDNAETVLFNLARGSSLKGAGGIPAVRGSIIRPLIDATPKEITSYLREKGLSFVTDSTNSDTDYTRNLIRAEIMPVLRRVNGEAEAHIREFSLGAREDSEYLALEAQKMKTDDISVLRSLHRAILKRVLILLAGECPLESVHINAMITLVEKGGQGSRVGLPGNRYALVDRGRLVISTQREPADYKVSLDRGINDISFLGCKIIISEDAISEDSLIIYKKSIHATVKNDKINGVYIRPRREGDSYRFMGHKRKVKKLLQSDKLTEAEKEALPILCDGEGILWVPGHGVRDGAWDEGGVHIYYCTGETDET